MLKVDTYQLCIVAYKEQGILKEAYLYVFYEYVSFLFIFFFFFNNFIHFMAVTIQTDFKIFNLEYHKKVSKVEHTCWLTILFYGSLHSAIGFVTLIFSQKGLTKHYSSASLELSCRTKYLRGVKKAPTFYIFTRFILTTSVNKKSFLCLSANIYK